MRLADYADDNGTLLDSLLRIFDLKYTTLRRERHRIVIVIVSEHGWWDGELCAVPGEEVGQASRTDKCPRIGLRGP